MVRIGLKGKKFNGKYPSNKGHFFKWVVGGKYCLSSQSPSRIFLVFCFTKISWKIQIFEKGIPKCTEHPRFCVENLKDTKYLGMLKLFDNLFSL